LALLTGRDGVVDSRDSRQNFADTHPLAAAAGHAGRADILLT
jgi:hypothetical protein